MINEMRTYGRRGRRPRTPAAVLYRELDVGMIFAEVASRCLPAKKELTLPNMKAALDR